MLVRLRHILYDAGVYARERGETERNLPCENEAIWSEHVAELFALCLKRLCPNIDGLKMGGRSKITRKPL